MNRILLVLTLAALALFCPFSHAGEVKKETASGGINWSSGLVYAIGYGTAKPELNPAQRRILSRRAAIVDAQRNLLEITKGVRIDSVIQTGPLMQQNRIVATRVEGIIKGAQIRSDHYQNEVATVTMVMPISGNFLRIVYPEDAYLDGENRSALTSAPPIVNHARRSLYQASDFILNALIPPTYAAEALHVESENEANAYKRLIDWMHVNGSAEIDKVLQQAVIDYETNAKFSGLLIDASGVPSFELATIPKIRDDEGNVIYPSKQTSYSDIVNKRGVTYDFDLQDAVRNGRVANTPFIIKAVSLYKTLPSDLVISKHDADNIMRSQSTVQAMNQAGVLIVVAL